MKLSKIILCFSATILSTAGMACAVPPAATPTPAAIPTSAPIVATSTRTSVTIPTLVSPIAPPSPTLVRTVTPAPTLTPAEPGMIGCQDVNARITRLMNDRRVTWTDFIAIQVVSGNVGIWTTVNKPTMQNWHVQYSGDNKKTWAVIGKPSTDSVTDLQRYAWATTAIPDGDYWLRLRIVDRAGNFEDPCEIHVIVKNVSGEQGLTVGCDDPQVQITDPKPNQIVTGTVIVRGSANRANFAYEKLEFSSDRNTWAPIGAQSIRPSINEILGSWQTRAIPNGEYWLRVSAVDKAGNFSACEIRATVKN
ncbi:MAG: hypothetical protein HY257_02915 [Chloroflexi bacterium]|nr:hypothetical protein [Chloroflexota bacterium]